MFNKPIASIAITLIIFYLVVGIDSHAAPKNTNENTQINDGSISALANAEADIVRHLEAIHGSVYVKKRSPCELETQQDTPGELAMHQEIVLNFLQVDFIKTGKTVGPGRNDAVQRKIAEKNPYAVFTESKAGGKIVTTKTWFDPNPYKLTESLTQEREFTFFTRTEADMAQLKEMIAIFSAQCQHAQ